MTRIERLLYYREVLGAAADRSPEHLRIAKAKLGRTDLFFLLVMLLKRADVNRDWIYERCNEVQAAPNGHLDLWARFHYKSTILSFAKIIQDILIDPEITIGIFSHTRPSAKGFLRQVKRELELNSELQSIYPEVLWENPEKQAPKWSEDDGLIVRRKSNPKESSLEAWGMDALPTGKHFKLRDYDDIIDASHVTNPDMIRRTIQQWELSLALRSEHGEERYAGTRYHSNDPYKEVLSRGSAKARIYPCTLEGTYPGTSVLLENKILEELRKGMGIFTFSAQMLQNPSADKAMGFKPDWLKYYTPRNNADNMNKYLLVDPANEKKKESDYTSMGVIGLGPDENYYLLDAIRDRLSLKERGDALFSLHRRWKPKAVGYEKYGMQSDIEYFQLRMGEENYRFEITPLGGQVAKHDRIRRLIPIFEAGRFYLPDTLLKTDYEGRTVDLTTAFVEEEFKPFPVGLHEDMFDMMARIIDEDLGVVWPKTKPEEDRYSKPKTRRPRGISWQAA